MSVYDVLGLVLYHSTRIRHLFHPPRLLSQFPHNRCSESKSVMTTKLSWRLSKLPTPSELTELVNAKVITQEEAKDILLSPVEERDSESLKEEIKFLRSLIDELSVNRSVIVETIREVAKPWQPWPWYGPYQVWCSSSTNYTNGSTLHNTSKLSDSSVTLSNNLSSVKTF